MDYFNLKFKIGISSMISLFVYIEKLLLFCEGCNYFILISFFIFLISER